MKRRLQDRQETYWPQAKHRTPTCVVLLGAKRHDENDARASPNRQAGIGRFVPFGNGDRKGSLVHRLSFNALGYPWFLDKRLIPSGMGVRNRM